MGGEKGGVKTTQHSPNDHIGKEMITTSKGEEREKSRKNWSGAGTNEQCQLKGRAA